MSCTGVVKSFNPMKSFGFITCQDFDIFVHASDCQGGMPKQGDMVTFDIIDSDKKPGAKVAKNVTGGTGALKGVMGTGAYRGTVKSFNSMKGFGFITYDGGDIFCHIRDCDGGMPQQGDMVAFDIEESAKKPGAMAAKNVTGGSGTLSTPPQGGKGDWGMGGGGMDWGMGGGGGYGPMWGGKGGKGSWDGGKGSWDGGKGSWGGGGCGPYGGKGGMMGGGKGGDMWGGKGGMMGCGKGGDMWGGKGGMGGMSSWW